MKTLVLFIILIVFQFKSVAQVPNLIVDSTKVWSVRMGHALPNSSGESTNSFRFKGDSIVGTITYKKIQICYEPTFQKWFFGGSLVREEAGLVYLKNINEEERIIYNFNLTVGESIVLHSMFGRPSEWTVISIDSVIIDGKIKKRMTLGNIEYPDVWIEGVGSLFGIIYPGNLDYDFSTDLLCVMGEASTYYSNPLFNTCYVEAVGVEAKQTANVLIYPTPFSGLLNIEHPFETCKIEIFNLEGALVYTDVLIGSSKINLTCLKRGLYVLKYESGTLVRFVKIFRK